MLCINIKVHETWDPLVLPDILHILQLSYVTSQLSEIEFDSNYERSEFILQDFNALNDQKLGYLFSIPLFHTSNNIKLLHLHVFFYSCP